eukprot:6814550-Pyramimonas_sp.AAC.2
MPAEGNGTIMEGPDQNCRNVEAFHGSPRLPAIESAHHPPEGGDTRLGAGGKPSTFLTAGGL